MSEPAYRHRLGSHSVRSLGRNDRSQPSRPNGVSSMLAPARWQRD